MPKSGLYQCGASITSTIGLINNAFTNLNVQPKEFAKLLDVMGNSLQGMQDEVGPAFANMTRTFQTFSFTGIKVATDLIAVIKAIGPSYAEGARGVRQAASAVDEFAHNVMDNKSRVNENLQAWLASGKSLGDLFEAIANKNDKYAQSILNNIYYGKSGEEECVEFLIKHKDHLSDLIKENE
jgi:phage-related minor tail protein